jgi:hypothetical protein
MVFPKREISPIVCCVFQSRLSRSIPGGLPDGEAYSEKKRAGLYWLPANGIEER